MKLAVMQPYFFPYVGYFQLLREVNKFVIYDDVSFIKRGWIHRNSILMNGEALRFTIPLQHASQSALIFETKLFPGWQEKFLRTIRQAYIKAPFFETIFPLIEKVVMHKNITISELALSSIQMVHKYLALDVTIQPSSVQYGNRHLKGQDRILDICIQEKCTTYCNLPGGRNLYQIADFTIANINLLFVEPKQLVYKQFGYKFVPKLSIIDVLMFNDKETVIAYLDNYELINA